MGIDSIRLNSVAPQPLPPIPDNHSKNFSAAKTSADQSKENSVPDGSTLHVGGRDDVTKAKLDSVKDKAKSGLDSMSEMGEMESLRLQMSMDRMSKMMSTLSNVLTKVSNTGAAITANLK